MGLLRPRNCKNPLPVKSKMAESIGIDECSYEITRTEWMENSVAAQDDDMSVEKY